MEITVAITVTILKATAECAPGPPYPTTSTKNDTITKSNARKQKTAFISRKAVGLKAFLNVTLPPTSKLPENNRETTLNVDPELPNEKSVSRKSLFLSPIEV